MNIGEIYFTNVPFTGKEKLIMIMGEDVTSSTFGFCIINSEINEKAIPPKALDYHLPLTQEACPCLNHDSNIDCSQLYEGSTPILASTVRNRTSRLIGAAPATLVETLRNTVRASPLLVLHRGRRFL